MREKRSETTGVKMGRRSFLAAATAAVCCASGVSGAQDAVGKGAKGQGGGRGGRGRASDSPALPAGLKELAGLSVVLGRVSDRTATVSLLSGAGSDVVLKWGDAAGGAWRSSKALKLDAGRPLEVELSGLGAGRATRYAVYEGVDGKALRAVGGECRVQTQRRAGSEFSFTVQGDSHPERPQMFDAGLYVRTLELIAADRPDLHVCMGDDFSLNTLHEITEQTVRSRYALQRPYLGLVGRSSPVFLVNGNHEQASLFNYNQAGVPHDASVWAQRARNDLFPQPAPDGFYSGNEAPLEGIGPMRNYYAWTWGDALFVVLDNYWHSPVCVDAQLREDDQKRSGKDRDWWGITLGDVQYEWFKKTLESSGAKLKFVFAHHVLGTGRGGIERAGLFEWGGKSNRGVMEFAAHRKGWAFPIHDLMVRTGVTVFFQGHDHLYARQELDGVVYQTCPLPADPNYTTYNEERYLSGIKQANSGYLRVRVEAHQATVQYVRSYLEKDKSVDRVHGDVAQEYTVKPRVKHE